jgi:hypothetical protein
MPYLSKMLNELIIKTNTEDFYSNGNLTPISIKGQIGEFDMVDLELEIEETKIDQSKEKYTSSKNIEYWNITAYKTIAFNNLYTPVYFPYVKLQLIKDHPLLWKYKTDELECELSGIPVNYNEFIGALYHVFTKNTGNWITINRCLFRLHGAKPEERKRVLIIPEPLRQPIMELCKDFSINFHVIHVTRGKNKGYANRPDLKLLMFGNEVVSPNKFNSRQPYIIAEDFKAKKRKNRA